MTGAGPAGHLLSVNVGLPKDVAWHGKTVHTGIWKRPLAGPGQVRRLNIDGDGQGDLAGHGGEHRAVFVYQIESYRYWQQQLSRDDFEYGQFGENFTVSGLADDQVCIGDRYQIGEALFEVTQPRVTCYRVGIRMNEPRMPSLLVSHHRPGFYFRVLREGAVRAGGRDRPGGRGAGGDDRGRGRQPALPARAFPRAGAGRAAHPSAARGRKASFRAVADQAGTPGGDQGNAGLTAVSPPPAWPGFRSLVVTAVDRETDSVVSVHLADPGGSALPPPGPGQFLTVRLNVVPGGALAVAQLLAVRPAGGRLLPHQCQARGARSREPVRVRPGPARQPAGGSRPARHVRAPAWRQAGPAGQRGRRGDPRAGHAARPRRRPAPGATSGGCTARAAGPRSHSPPRPSPCWPGWRTATGTSATAIPGPATCWEVTIRARDACPLSVLACVGLPADADAYICGPAAFMTEISAALVDLGIDGARVRTEILPPGGYPHRRL